MQNKDTLRKSVTKMEIEVGYRQLSLGTDLVLFLGLNLGLGVGVG